MPSPSFDALAGIALALSAFPAAAVSGPPAEPPPPIVLLLVDDLGWTDLGCTGSRYFETPAIDRLAAAGAKFTSAYSAGPNCAPSRASLLTGRYPPRHGVTQVGARPRGRAQDRRLVEHPSRTALAPEEVTIAEALAPAGYVSAVVGKWQLGDGESAPFAQGFAVDRTGPNPGYHGPWKKPIAGIGRGAEGEYLTERLAEESAAFVRAHAGEPFFLFHAFHAVHTPIQPRRELRERFAARPAPGLQRHAGYAAMVASVDAAVGRILGALEEAGLADEALVILTSDNGGHERYTSNLPLRGGKGMLYEGGIRVPLIVRWPGRVPPGAVVDAPVSQIDLFPTLLEAAGLAPPADLALDGASLLPLLTGGGPPPHEALFWHFPHYLEGYVPAHGLWRTTPAGAIRMGRYKLIEFFEDGRTELFDLAADIGETRDLATERPGLAHELRERLSAWRVAVGARLPEGSAVAH